MTSQPSVRIVPRKKLHWKPGKEKQAPVQLTQQDILKLFHVRQTEAAKMLGISLTALKSACRILGLPRWPYHRVDIDEKASRMAQSTGLVEVLSSECFEPLFLATDSFSSPQSPPSNGYDSTGYQKYDLQLQSAFTCMNSQHNQASYEFQMGTRIASGKRSTAHSNISDFGENREFERLVVWPHNLETRRENSTLELFDEALQHCCMSN
ncbi:hypothetical protein GUITHDRAFT_114049 [Guillardia theta CCMP2712]|uniref:RWP-RK domain-containing protein n=1 Tax=Guillardia theta (strain CCMP2712) TaxID=905079 RepID=L1IVB1_GUITC|nr:hypothetical protein GUITHDRAFT_114049 [Guillardia theta CCMP2712]EKX39799.1 hypothetical protein GUITHDRAFT_114049 [Guillardia theta CCMP2712]|eukprot:XP_005826779.1 hypothetical protein GUITHDRAFT_114049 [Guillardia theta CCMP2712]